MRCLALMFGILFLPATAQAYCEDLWLTRNIVFDRAGYCFGSVLGQSIFDNSDCTTKTPELSAEDRALVDSIKQHEARNGCRVDTSARALSLPTVEWRRAMLMLPIRDEFESACIGWKGPPVPLRVDVSPTAAVTATVAAGDTLLYSHYPEGDYWFVTLIRSEVTVAEGWAIVPDEVTHCTQIAG